MQNTNTRHEHINPDGLLSFEGISQVVKASTGRTVFISGQSAFNKQFELIGGSDFKEQAMAALRNVATAVKAAGGNPSDVVSSTIYIKGLNGQRSALFFEAMTKALDGKPFPTHACSVIGVQELGAPEQLIEIASIAILNN